MAINILSVTGDDLDLVFDPKSTSTAAATGFYNSAGTDLNQIYAAAADGTANAATTNLVSQAGGDLATIFAGIGTVSSDTIYLAGGTVFNQDLTSPYSVYAGIKALSTGQFQKCNRTRLYTTQFDWITPTSSAPGDYQIRFTLTSGTTFSGVASGTWYALTSDRECYLFRSSAGNSSCGVTVDIRKGTGAILATASWSLTASAGAL